MKNIIWWLNYWPKWFWFRLNNRDLGEHKFHQLGAYPVAAPEKHLYCYKCKVIFKDPYFNK